MSWRTRHIRKKNKGKGKTKRQIGGASVEVLKNIISYLVKKGEDIPAMIEDKNVTINFASSSTFNGVTGIEGKFPFEVLRNAMFSAKIVIGTNNISIKNNINGKTLIIDASKLK